MKITFTLFVSVILWEYLPKTDANFKKSAANQHFARLQIANRTKENPTSNTHVEALEIDLRSSFKLSKNQIEKNIHQAAKIKMMKIDKLVKSSKQKIKSVAERNGIKNLKLIEMSNDELFQSEKSILLKANKITGEILNDFRDVVKLSVDKLRNLFETTGEDISELAESFADKITKYSSECENKIKRLLLEDQILKTKAVATVDVDDIHKLAFCIDRRLTEVQQDYETKINGFENNTSQSVLDLATHMNERYIDVSSSNKAFQYYIVTMTNRISELAHHTCDKFKDLIKYSFTKLFELAHDSGDLIKELAKVEGEVEIATVNEDNNEINKLKAKISVLLSKMKKSNKRVYEELVKQVTNQGQNTWHDVQEETTHLESFSPTQP